MLRRLKEGISWVFYHHGLFCASHPIPIITSVAIIIIFTCYPLSLLSLQANTPLQVTTPIEGFQLPPNVPPPPQEPESEKHPKRPLWYYGRPVAYIQQIVVKTAVSPWDVKRLIPSDAFRAPLSTTFDILEDVRHFVYHKGSVTQSVSDHCLRVSEPDRARQMKGLLPQYGCLLVSPAQFWGLDKDKFNNDADIVKSIYQTVSPSVDTPPFLRDILFGLSWRQTGIRKYYLRNRQRVISYAVTIVLSEYNPEFLAALKQRLQNEYQFTAAGGHGNISVSEGEDELVHIYYKNISFFVEYFPLLVAYFVLFLYIYFSVRKIELVKSKWGLALSAVFTIVASLFMSISICMTVGITQSLKGSEIFPYLVVLIGLENVLVVTKSVVSTPVHLDVKLRVAQGLSKEGWYIFKYFITELFILIVGLLTFVPAIQEFCLFATVGLFTDFFLQMFFFTTVLSIDIRRMELSDLQHQSMQSDLQDTSPSPPSSTVSSFLHHLASPTVSRAPLTGNAPVQTLHTPMPTPKSYKAACQTGAYYPGPKPYKIPRRMRLLNFWARARIAQKGLIACVFIWILLIMYKSGLVQHVFQMESENANITTPPLSQILHTDAHENHLDDKSPSRPDSILDHASRPNAILDHGQQTWKHLSPVHWPTLMGYYNISLLGRYITVLPSIHLSAIVTPDRALELRHPLEQRTSPHMTDEAHEEGNLSERTRYLDNQSIVVNFDIFVKRITRWPQTGSELAVTTLISVFTLLILPFLLILLYRCMCPRKYSRWHPPWVNRKPKQRSSQYFKQIRESIPLVLDGHTQEIECLITDGPLIVSSCLGGQLRMWDSNSGECLISIKRRRVLPVQRHPIPGRNINDSDADLFEEYHGGFQPPYTMSSSLPQPSYTQPRSRENSTDSPARPGKTRKMYQSHARHKSADWHFADLAPDLSSTIETDFSSLASQKGGLARSSSELSDYDLSAGDFSYNKLGQSPCYGSVTAQDGRARHAGSDQTDTRDGSARTIPRTDSGGKDTCGVADQRGRTDSRGATTPRSLSYTQSHSDNDPRGGTDIRGSTDAGMEHCVSTSPCDIPTTQRDRQDSTSQRDRQDSTGEPYDFRSRFQVYFEEHQQLVAEKEVYLKQRQVVEAESWLVSHARQQRSLSSGESQTSLVEYDATINDHHFTGDTAPVVWCLACQANLIVAGCGDGRIEFWDGQSGQLKCLYHQSDVGVTAICFVAHRVVAARLNGYVDFLELESFVNVHRSSSSHGAGPTALHRHTRVAARTTSPAGSTADLTCWDDIIHCVLVGTSRAHQRPINLLACEGGRVLTGSQDHTLKVFRLEDSLCLYTLHGHSGSITALYLDKVAPLAAVSGAEDGSVRLWDLLTGSCVHKFSGHISAVTSLTCTPMYVISAGTDDRMCIWERRGGQLLHWLILEGGVCNSVAMLTSNLLVTGGQGCMYLWDVAKGDVLRTVELGDSGQAVSTNHLTPIGNAAIVCDYGTQLRVVHFPAVLEKAD